jgi:PGF-pre-PGF domain-containing protein
LFDFPQKATPVIYICFDSKKTVGKTTTIVEMLRRKSALVPMLPSDKVYKSINIWVGNGGYGDSKSIENSVIYFMVEKSWVQDNNIDKSTITLNRYSDNIWNQLPTSLLREDDNYLYYTAQAPGFSSFAITGETSASETVKEKQNQPTTQGLEQNTSNKITGSEKVSARMAGFEVFYGILSLLAIFLLQRK